MINVHLNGDIVRCPDIAEIHKRLNEIRDKHRICIYNIHESTCHVWQNTHQNISGMKIAKCTGRCSLAGFIDCPGHIRQSEHSHKLKTFKIDNKVYRKMSSAAHYMVKTAKYKTLFLTFTFPPFKHIVNEKQINQAFSRFMDNLHNTYGVKYYIAVREHGDENDRVHFHTLLSIKFVDFTIINAAWCSAISNICDFSPSALRTTKETVIIRDPIKALRYCCKYFAKQRGSKSTSRIVFIANNLLTHRDDSGKRISNIQSRDYISVNDILKGFKGVYIQQTSDFTTCFRITNNEDFEIFCNTYLYTLFELSYKKTDFSGLPGSFN